MTFLYRQSLLLSFLASVGALGGALVSQYFFSLQPCVLCVYQRWPYVAVIILALAGLALAKKLGVCVFQLLIATGFAVTSGIGMFHVGVEQGWWKGTSECVADTAKTLSLDELRSQIMSAPLVKCNEIAWELFGISMAGYNVLFAGAMALFMILALSHKPAVQPHIDN